MFKYFFKVKIQYETGGTIIGFLQNLIQRFVKTEK